MDMESSMMAIAWPTAASSLELTESSDTSSVSQMPLFRLSTSKSSARGCKNSLGLFLLAIDTPSSGCVLSEVTRLM